MLPYYIRFSLPSIPTQSFNCSADLVKVCRLLCNVSALIILLLRTTLFNNMEAMDVKLEIMTTNRSNMDVQAGSKESFTSNKIMSIYPFIPWFPS